MRQTEIEFAREMNNRSKVGEREGEREARWFLLFEVRARASERSVLLSRETTGPNSSVKTALRDSTLARLRGFP